MKGKKNQVKSESFCVSIITTEARPEIPGYDPRNIEKMSRKKILEVMNKFIMQAAPIMERGVEVAKAAHNCKGKEFGINTSTDSKSWREMRSYVFTSAKNVGKFLADVERINPAAIIQVSRNETVGLWGRNQQFIGISDDDIRIIRQASMESSAKGKPTHSTKSVPIRDR